MAAGKHAGEYTSAQHVPVGLAGKGGTESVNSVSAVSNKGGHVIARGAIDSSYNQVGSSLQNQIFTS